MFFERFKVIMKLSSLEVFGSDRRKISRSGIRREPISDFPRLPGWDEVAGPRGADCNRLALIMAALGVGQLNRNQLAQTSLIRSVWPTGSVQPSREPGQGFA